MSLAFSTQPVSQVIFLDEATSFDKLELRFREAPIPNTGKGFRIPKQ